MLGKKPQILYRSERNCLHFRIWESTWMGQILFPISSWSEFCRDLCRQVNSFPETICPRTRYVASMYSVLVWFLDLVAKNGLYFFKWRAKDLTEFSSSWADIFCNLFSKSKRSPSSTTRVKAKFVITEALFIELWILNNYRHKYQLHLRKICLPQCKMRHAIFRGS